MLTEIQPLYFDNLLLILNFKFYYRCLSCYCASADAVATFTADNATITTFAARTPAANTAVAALISCC